jgi:hypothetical protein
MAQTFQGGGARATTMENPPMLAPASRPATFHAALEPEVSILTQTGAPFASELQPRTNVQPNDLSLEGLLGYTVSGDRTTLNLRAERVSNNRSSGVSGSIRLSLWATAIRPSYGSTTTGYRMGYYQFTSTLQPGFYFGPVDRTVPFALPADGTYYVTMFLEEYNGINPSMNDGYSYHDLYVFSNQLTVGPTQNAATIVDHAMTSGVNSSTLLNVDRLTSFAHTAAGAISWIKLNPFLGPHTLQWKYFAPDGSLYYDSGSSVQTGVPGYDYYAYYVGIPIAGTAAATKPGLWQARVFLDGVNAVTENFTITAPSSGTCTPSATKVCLNKNRFGVSVSWRTAAGQTGQGQAIKYTADSGLFWFFGSENIEMITKVLDACGLNQRYWLFAAATTDVEYTITVTDSKTNTTKTYFHAVGSPAPAITDTGAFATCP